MDESCWGAILSGGGLESYANELGVPTDYVGALHIHREKHRDLFATSSLALLKRQQRPGELSSNIFDPLEAARIMGLFLRGREDHHVSNSLSIGRIGFYGDLTRYLTPALGRYFTHCYHASKSRRDNTSKIAQAIRARCVRAVQARDAIGLQFYQPQNNGTRDQMMYHVDYLAVLIAGALDGQARIAKRTYSINVREKILNFWNPEFIQGIKASEATDLAGLITGSIFGHYKGLLRTIRNTIHDAGLLGIGGYSDRSRPGSLAELSQHDYESISGAVEQLGGAVHWGLDPRGIEPNAFAMQLVRYGLAFINAIAEATDVTRLYTADEPPQPLDRPVQRDKYFDSPKFLDELLILGEGTTTTFPRFVL